MPVWKGCLMTFYRYNALDIAAYFKWTSMPADTERIYLDLLFQMREQILARPLAKDFESFVRAVFREMYHVWARGFENEFSDVKRIAPEDAVSLFCDQKFIVLESYMRLLSLHLILAENLPYVRINFVGLPLLIGLDGAFSEFEQNLTVAAKTLQLVARDDRGNEYDLSLGVPNEPLCVGLRSEFRREIFGSVGYRVKRNNDYQEKMRLLRIKSKMDQDTQDMLRKASEAKRSVRTQTAITKNIPTALPSDKPSGIPNPLSTDKKDNRKTKQTKRKGELHA